MERAPVAWGLRLLVLSSAALWGCGSLPASRLPDGRAALQRLAATQACSGGVRAEVDADFFGAEGRVRGSVVVQASYPDRVRFDVYSPFGLILSTLTADGSRFGLYDLQHRRFLYGPAKACNVARFTRMPVPPHALTSILRGQAPLLKHDPAALKLEPKSESYVLTIGGAHQALEEVEIAPYASDFARPWQEQRFRLLRVALQQGGVPLWDVELRGHDRALTASAFKDPDGLDPDVPPSGPRCDAELPRRVRIRVPSTGQDLLLTVQSGKIVHNPPLLPGAFSQAAPEGVAVLPVDCR